MATDFIKNYVGIDPNKDLIKNYASQISKFGPDRSIAMISAPAEEALDNLNYSPDLVFTSPPYFIIERYSKDKSQSWQRYKKLGAWLDKFLFPCIEKSWNILVSGGHMAINISDVYCNHTINKICDPMNDFISTLPSAEKIDNLNYKMAKRLNSKSDKTGIFVEPVWCWRKN